MTTTDKVWGDYPVYYKQPYRVCIRIKSRAALDEWEFRQLNQSEIVDAIIKKRLLHTSVYQMLCSCPLIFPTMKTLHSTIRLNKY